jgi:carbamoyl-phosphate synthase large subunit
VEVFPILFSSAGRRGALVGLLRESLHRLGLGGLVHACDVTPYAAALQLADRRHLVPRHDDPRFIDAVLEICVRDGIRLVVPTHDAELPLYAAARQRFAEIGCTVSISGPATVAIGRDKRRTNEWLRSTGLPCVRQGTPAEVQAAPDRWRWPLIVKPRAGSAGIGVRVVHRGERLDDDPDVIVEERATGDEHTVDLLILGDGTCPIVVPRRRLEVRAGEVSKGATVRHAALESLARRAAGLLPDAYGVLNLQVFADGEELRIIELNARYGGGFPLAYEAGARLPEWTIEELLGRTSTIVDDWRGGVVMLRYDEAVFVDAATLAADSASSAYHDG